MLLVSASSSMSHARMPHHKHASGPASGATRRASDHGPITLVSPVGSCRRSSSFSSEAPASLGLGLSRSPPALRRSARDLATPICAMSKHVGSFSAALDLSPQPGSVIQVHSASELSDVLSSCASQLVVLMCKARSCRACTYFTKKYHRVAQHHPDCIFLELTCDESREAYRLMEEIQVPAIPHFVMYEQGSERTRLSCSSEDKLEQAIQSVHPNDVY